jgi:hypothetical protein
MSLDDFMFAMIIAGVVLSGAHLRISFRRWRFDNAAALRRELTHRNLHANRLSSSLTSDSSASMKNVTDAGIAESQGVTRSGSP